MLRYRDFFPQAAEIEPAVGLAQDRLLGDVLPLGILVTNEGGKCLYSNAAYQKLCGWSGDDIVGSHWSSVIHPEDHDRAIGQWNAAELGKQPFLTEARLQRADGEVIWTRRNAAMLTDSLPCRGFVHAIEDISADRAHERARRKADEDLFEEKERAQVTLDSIGDAVLSTNIDGRVSYMNIVAEVLTGFSRHEAIGRPLSDIFRVVNADTHEPTTDPAQRAIRSDSTVALEANTLLITKDGMELAIEDSAAPIHNRYGVIIGAVIVFHDARLSLETTARMAFLAQHDALTGLANRNTFTERFAQALALATRHKKRMGLLFIDIDHFKTINDSLGHDCGDILLTSLAVKFQSCVRITDTVSRFGGDEFVVLLSEIDRPDQVLAVAKKIQAMVATPTEIDGKDIPVQLSIGVSIYPDDGDTIEALLKCADASMYRVKKLNQYHVATGLQPLPSKSRPKPLSTPLPLPLPLPSQGPSANQAEIPGDRFPL